MNKVHNCVVYTVDKGINKENGSLCSVFGFREECVCIHLETMGYKTYPKDGPHNHC